MFQPESPPPSHYHHKKTSLNKKKEKKQNFWVGKVFAWFFIIVGLTTIIAMIALSPPNKRLVCSTPVIGRASLITFGTCHFE